MKQDDSWEEIQKWLEPKAPLYCPHEPYMKQKIFLRYEGKECLYGGRAGGGKSDALLMAALQYVDVPHYAAIIFRNTYSDLSLPGAIMDRSHDWLDECDEARWNNGKATWSFKSGATLTFGYLDKPDDHLRYKGAEFQYVGFDEVTEIREQHYKYLFSRLRKPSGLAQMALSKVPIRMRAASNPAPNWVRRRFIEEGKKAGRLYIPAGVEDNPFLNKEEYEESLKELDPVDRARLEKGDWWAEEAGAKFLRENFQVISPEEVDETAFMNQVRYWDLASTEVSPSNQDPDWTAGALVSITDGYLIIHDMKHFRKGPAGVEREILRTAYEDGPFVKIRMEQEGGATGKMTIDHFARHVLLGYDFDGHPATKNKEARIDRWAPMVRRKQVLLVRGDWIRQFMDEAVAFGAASEIHDDQLDAVSGAFEMLTGLGEKRKSKVEIIV